MSRLAGLDVTVTIESGSGSPYATVDDSWPLSEGPDLSITPRQLKLLSYTVTTNEGNVRGRHFVLLKEFKKNELNESRTRFYEL